MSPIRKLILLCILILVPLVGGTAGYMIIEGASLLDALFMTVITLASVGYREVIPLSHAGQIFTVILITLGVGTITLSIYMIGGIVVEGQIRKVFGRRYVERQIQKLKDHYIICGYGRMGSVLAAQLEQEHVPTVVIEQDSVALQRLSTSDHLFVEGTPRSRMCWKPPISGARKG